MVSFRFGARLADSDASNQIERENERERDRVREKKSKSKTTIILPSKTSKVSRYIEEYLAGMKKKVEKTETFGKK